MHTERILSAGMAIVVIAAVGLSASTLATSMSTDPADAVDVQWDQLPLGDDSQGEIEAAAEDVDERYQQSESGSGDSQSGGSGDAGEPDAQVGDGDASEQQADEEADSDASEQPGERAGEQESVGEQPGDGEREADSADGSGAEQSGGSAGPGEGGLAPAGWSWSLLWWVALLLAVVALAYRYRDRLRRALGPGDDGQGAEPLEPAPGNDVERAWVELVERAGIDRPHARTPRDCARRAVERGFDPDAVDRLRRTFEDVQYGTTPPSEEQARLARETLARLDGERA